MSNQIVLKLLSELRVVLDRLRENDSTLREAVVHDVDRAIRLADSCLSHLSEEETAGGFDVEEDEDDDDT